MESKWFDSISQYTIINHIIDYHQKVNSFKTQEIHSVEWGICLNAALYLLRLILIS